MGLATGLSRMRIGLRRERVGNNFNPLPGSCASKFISVRTPGNIPLLPTEEKDTFGCRRNHPRSFRSSTTRFRQTTASGMEAAGFSAASMLTVFPKNKSEIESGGLVNLSVVATVAHLKSSVVLLG